jgi:hypothetical protein
LLELLYCVTNVRSLVLFQKPRVPISDKQMEIVRLISNNSKITHVHVNAICTIGHVRLLLDLCPRLERLIMGVEVDDLQSIVRYLLMKSAHTHNYLYSLSLSTKFNGKTIKQLRKMIDNEKLLDDYWMGCIKKTVRLWW